MTLSAVYITKNEEKTIQRSIKSLKDVVDEIVIVDTGSTDNTIGVCKEYTNLIYDFEWVRDFSLARNYAISKCTGDYVIFLDADEYFETPLNETDKQNIFEAFEDKDSDGIGFCFKDIEETTGKLHSMSFMCKCFRNNGTIKYVKPIHETLVKLDGSPLQACVCKVPNIFHTGYSYSVQKSKVERNLELLLKIKEKAVMDYFYLCRENLSLGNIEEADKYSKLFFEQENYQKEIENNNLAYNIYIYTYNIRQKLKDKYSYADLTQWLLTSMKAIPHIPEIYYVAGKHYFSTDLGKSEKYFLKAISQQDRFVAEGCTLINGFCSFEPRIYYYLSKISELKKDKAQAITRAIVSIWKDRENIGYKKHFLQLLDTNNYDNNIKIIDQVMSLKKAKDYETLVILLADTNFVEEFAHYALIYNTQFQGSDLTVFYAMVLSGAREIVYDTIKDRTERDIEFLKMFCTLYCFYSCPELSKKFENSITCEDFKTIIKKIEENELTALSPEQQKTATDLLIRMSYYYTDEFMEDIIIESDLGEHINNLIIALSEQNKYGLIYRILGSLKYAEILVNSPSLKQFYAYALFKLGKDEQLIALCDDYFCPEFINIAGILREAKTNDKALLEVKKKTLKRLMCNAKNQPSV